MSELTQIASSIEDLKVKPNKTLVLKIISQENVPDEVIQRFSVNVGKLGYTCFLPEKRIDVSQVADLPDLTEEDAGKSPAQRLRATLWRIWEQGGKQGDFELAYRRDMERIIEKLKERLT